VGDGVRRVGVVAGGGVLAGDERGGIAGECGDDVPERE